MVSFPYSYYRCSCAGARQLDAGVPSLTSAPSTTTATTATSDTTGDTATPGSSQPAAAPTTTSIGAAAGVDNGNDDDDDLEDQDETFDPSDPRSNYSLFPLDALMWCEDCQDIRCPRCTSEEVICWYCPNCLFEVPSSTVRSDGNRCTRNCFNCPECTAQLAINSLNPDPNSTSGPYILSCGYCNWTSLDIGMKFSTPRYIYNQLQQSQASGGSLASSKATSSSSRLQSSHVLETVPEPGDSENALLGAADIPRATSPGTTSGATEPRRPQDPNARFQALKSFFKQQLQAANPTDGLMYSDLNYSSPGHLSRVLALYSSSRSAGGASGGSAHNKGTAKPVAMREAADVSEGLQLLSPELDRARVDRLTEAGWSGTASLEQRRGQGGWGGNGAGGSTKSEARLLKDLRPVPTLLRTKRSARCRACRHILVKPEAKIGSTRHRIKLAAAEHVPAMALKPLGLLPGHASAAEQQPALDIDLHALPPSRTLQFLLKLTNRIVDTTIRVTLATPRETPGGKYGRGGSRVTILCPQFDIGANLDVWDEALRGGGSTSRGGGAASPTKASSSASAALTAGAGGSEKSGPGQAVAEAGKPWERGRNWTSVVVEVVPRRQAKATTELDEDEDVLEIPIFVRLEFSKEDGGSGGGGGSTGGAEGGRQEEKNAAAKDGTDGSAGASGAGGGGGDAAARRKGQRQLSYWTVLGVGRIRTEAIASSAAEAASSAAAPVAA